MGEPRRGWAVAFNRNEVAGAFGDIGTDLPLILALIAINGLDATSAFVMFGVFQILSALRYGLPMPVQPLKAMAAIMIATAARPELLFGGGLVIGLTIGILGLTGAITRIHALLPAGVVRGIQLGLGLTLMLVAFGFILGDPGAPLPDRIPGMIAAFVGILAVLFLGRSTRFPPALLLIVGGIGLAAFQGLDFGALAGGIGFRLPVLYLPEFLADLIPGARVLSLNDIAEGGLVLALPQIPLSIANSIIATAFLVRDYFPRRTEITPRRISLTYAAMNLTGPFFGAIPACHGSGGLAGHHRFGARTGGSVIIYGTIFLVLGLFFGGVIFEAVKVFPFPVLGALLLFEGFALTKLVTKVKDSRPDLLVALLVGVLVIGVPFGFVVGILGGTAVYFLLVRKRIFL
ncbi:MAG: putative sulfate/molybdate transporter [Thermoplasmata archaeon]